MLSTPAAAREQAMKAIQGQELTRHFGRPTFKSVSKTRDKVTSIYAAAKTSHPSFPYGSKFGFAPAVMKTSKFRDLHTKTIADIDAIDPLDEDWVFETPSRPDVYDAAINAGMSDQVIKKREAKRKDEILQFDIFQGYEAVAKEKIAAAYDKTWLEGLRNKILGFTHVTANKMLDELELKSHALTYSEKQLKLNEFNLAWNQDDDIEHYFTKVDDLEEELDDH